MKKLLIFQHEFKEHPSRINQYALEHDIELDVIRLWEPYTIPDAKHYSALIILGGSMGVNDDFPSKHDEVAFIKKNLGSLPILGICLGSQLLAHVLGAPVVQMMKEGRRFYEIGFSDVTLTTEGKGNPLFKGFPDTFRVSQIHGDTFGIPEGATCLGTGEKCANQAFSYGANTFGTQFHLEFTPYALAHLFAKHKNDIPDFENEEARLMEEAFKTESMLQKNFDRMMDNLLSV